MFAQLSQKLALTAAKAVCITTRGDQYAKHLIFDLQWRDDQRAQSAVSETLGKLKRNVGDVRFIHELTANTLRQRVLINRDLSVFRDSKRRCKRVAART